jgi:hypothetical protein
MSQPSARPGNEQQLLRKKRPRGQAVDRTGIGDSLSKFKPQKYFGKKVTPARSARITKIKEEKQTRLA